MQVAPEALLVFVHARLPGANVQTSHTMRFSELQLVSQGDVIVGVMNGTFFGGKVIFNLSVDGELMCCVDAWPQATPKEHGACMWRNDMGRRILVDHTNIQSTVISCTQGNMTRTLLPLGCR